MQTENFVLFVLVLLVNKALHTKQLVFFDTKSLHFFVVSLAEDLPIGVCNLDLLLLQLISELLGESWELVLLGHRR